MTTDLERLVYSLQTARGRLFGLERDLMEERARVGNLTVMHSDLTAEITRLEAALLECVHSVAEQNTLTPQKSEPTQVESDNVKSNVSEAAAEVDVTVNKPVAE